jgi:hypothetical protein
VDCLFQLFDSDAVDITVAALKVLKAIVRGPQEHAFLAPVLEFVVRLILEKKLDKEISECLAVLQTIATVHVGFETVLGALAPIFANCPRGILSLLRFRKSLRI